MQKVNVILQKDELDSLRAPGKVAIVLDIIFATTTIVTALHQGARSVIPALDELQARQAAAGRDPASLVLAGEYHADTLSGFHPYNPLAMQTSVIGGKDLIYSTTNGTVALCNAQACNQVYVGALLNAQALTRHVLQHYPNETILLVCAGSRGAFSLEDFFGAGYFVQQLLKQGGDARITLSDPAIAALHLFERNSPLQTLLSSKVGQRLAGRGMLPDIHHCAQLDTHPIVPALIDGSIVCL
ncbi:MAG: 2-phosphosulfolactate phosphatase [Burkholderiaceae bacterium]|nr:2-phosphosulfolactate phosphatase [Burkholderiaceae bacterium]